MGKTQKSHQGVTYRSLIIAIILIPVNCYWVIEMEVIRYSGHPVTISLFFNVVFNIFVLIALNLLLKKFFPKHTLRQSELLVIYIMLSLASGIAGHDMLEILVPMLGHAYWFATPENEWAELFHRYIPSWLTVSDESALDGYYNGEISLYTAHQLKAWLQPVLWWTAFIFALVFVMLCINVIVRKRWTQSEKLSYPIIQLPLEMTNPSMSLFRSRFMWMGFAIAAFLTVLNGLNSFFPAIPQIPIRVRYITVFTDKPWNAMGSIPISFYPFAIGLGFFIPLDLAFSCWFFFWFWRIQRVIGSALGLRSLPGFPYTNEQASGGYLGLAIIALWVSRNHIIEVFKKVVGYRTDLDDSDEPMRYRTAVLGGIGGMAFIFFFCSKFGVSSVFYKSAAGMSSMVVIVFFAIYLAISTAVTRMRAELGSPVHDLHYAGPDQIMVRVLGTRRLGPGNLGMFSMFWFINRAYRSHPMPHQLEGFEIARRTRIQSSSLVFPMMLVAGLSSLTAFWAYLHIFYKLGAAGSFAWEPFNRLQHWLTLSQSTDYPAVGFTGFSFIFTLFIMFMRRRFLWWPFHPVGYVLSGTWSVDNIWMPLFISWLAKMIFTKYGGIKMYRRAVPFFAGLILGQFIIGGIWSLLGTFFNIPIKFYFV